MKKIKLLAPLTAITLVGAATPLISLTSCNNHNPSEPTSQSYKASINKSSRFTYDEKKIGAEVVKAGQVYEIQLTPAENFKITKSNISVSIGKYKFDGFAFENNKITIPSYATHDNIDIHVDTTVINILNIDANHQLKGFMPGVTKEEINQTCKGILIIPMDVVSIAQYAFCDETTGISTIPNEITQLVFEEHIMLDPTNPDKMIGYSALHNETGADSAIGKCAFKNAPFEGHLKLPFGSGYDIGESAFEGIKINSLQLPEPGFIASEEQRIEVGGAALGEMIGLNFARSHGGAETWVKSHYYRVGKKSFYNVRSLTSLFLSPFCYPNVAFGDDCFALETSAELPDKRSHINYLDLTSWTFARMWDVGNGSGQYGFAYALDEQQKFIRSGYFSYPPDFMYNLRWDDVQGEPARTYSTKVHVAVLNYCDENRISSAEWLNMINQIQKWLGSDVISSDASRVWQVGNSYVLFPCAHNMYHGFNSYQSEMDYFRFENNEISISLSQLETTRISEVHVANLSSPSQSLKYCLRGDMEFEITNARWIEGTPINLNLKHIKVSDDRITEKATYTNNKFAVEWDDGVTPNGIVELTITIRNKSTLRESTNQKLKITFDA